MISLSEASSELEGLLATDSTIQALEYLNKLSEIDDAMGYLYVLFSRYYSYVQDYPSALDALTKATQLYPENINHWSELFVFKLSFGHLSDTACVKALKSYSWDSEVACFLIATDLFRTGRFLDVIKVINQHLTCSSALLSPRLHLLKLIALLRNSNDDAVINQIGDFLQNDYPNNREILPRACRSFLLPFTVLSDRVSYISDSLRIRRLHRCSDARAKTLLLDAIRESKPFSYIRASDGEGCFLSYYQDLILSAPAISPAIKAESLILGMSIWSIWFGSRDIRSEDPKLIKALGAELTKAICSADVLGTVTDEEASSEMGFLSRLGCLALLSRVSLFRSTGLFRGEHAHMNLLLSSDQEHSSPCQFLDTVLRLSTNQVWITCHANIADRLRRKYSCNVTSIGCSHQASHSQQFGLDEALLEGNPHLYRDFPQIIKKLKAVCRPGVVVFVAAGFLGKIYCATAKRCGAVAVDLGAIADQLAGHNTRDSLNQFSSLLE